jgi:hypothetical protein
MDLGSSDGLYSVFKQYERIKFIVAGPCYSCRKQPFSNVHNDFASRVDYLKKRAL